MFAWQSSIYNSVPCYGTPPKKKLKNQYNPSQTVLNSLLSFLYYLMSHQGSFKNGVVVV